MIRKPFRRDRLRFSADRAHKFRLPAIRRPTKSLENLNRRKCEGAYVRSTDCQSVEIRSVAGFLAVWCARYVPDSGDTTTPDRPTPHSKHPAIRLAYTLMVSL
jgi:hypothetical protein